MRVAKSRGMLRRNLSGTDTTWSDELLDGAIARAAEDLNRLHPLEKMDGITLNFDVKAEVWDSKTLGNTVSLANTRIKPKSEVVTNAAASTTYVRDTDYTIDYALGTIIALSSGAIPADQNDLLIDYTLLEIYLDTGGLKDLIRVIRVEYPAGKVPIAFQPFYTWADHVVILNKGMDTQTRLADKEHAWIYYYATHVLPGIKVDSSWPPQLDEVVIKGAEGHSLFTKALELRHNASAKLVTSIAKLGEIAGIEVEIDSALANTANQATSASTDLGNIDPRITDMLATLAAAGGFLSSAGQAIVAAISQADQAEREITSIDTPLAVATSKLAAVDALVNNVLSILANVRTHIAVAASPLTTARNDISKARVALDASMAKQSAASGARSSAKGRLADADSRIDLAFFYVNNKVDSLLNATGGNLSDFIDAVGNNLTDAKSRLTAGQTIIDRVNIGELVSENQRRYAETYTAMGRLRLDEFLSYYGKVDRFIAISNNLIAEAGEFRAQAEVWIQSGNLAIAEMTQLLGQVRGFQESASQLTANGRAVIEGGQVTAQAAQTATGLVLGGIEQANASVSIARLRLDAASESSDLVQAHIASATQYIAMAQAKIAEGNAKSTPIDAILNRVTRKIEIARIFQQESDRRIRELELKQQESDRYINLSVQEALLADGFEARGVLLRQEFMSILEDRAQTRNNTSLVAVKQ